jgi:competence protein ComEA
MYRKFKQYFEISPKEFRGMMVFVLLLLICLAFPFLCEKLTEQPLAISIQTLSPKIIEIDKFKEQPNSYKDKQGTNDAKSAAQLFNFNPNNLSVSDWMRLGLTLKQANSIKNYEAKGGKFRSKSDVKKMYAIADLKYAELEPYIQIPTESSESTAPLPQSAEFHVSKKSAEFLLVDINTADSLKMLTIKGVGPAFAARIIKYRSKLGGFYAKHQIKEIYGIDSLKYEQLAPQIYLSQIPLKQININQCTFEDIKSFPYLNYKQMNVMINYRIQHGNFKSIDDLNKIAIFSPEIIQKIRPYISF